MGAYSQVEALKRDSARLTAENNQLHLQLMSQSEQLAATQRENYHQTKRLEDQLAELTFLKQKTIERYLALEQENEGLREKLGSILTSAPTGKLCVSVFGARRTFWDVIRERQDSVVGQSSTTLNYV